MAAADAKKAAAQAALEVAQAAVEAAEAAIFKRDADARAAEEARIAAEKAAAERDLATKRLGHVIRLIAEVEAIRARRDAGDKTLDSLQLKKAGRLGDLQKEKAALEAKLATL